MSDSKELEEFAANILQEVMARAESYDDGALREEEFTGLCIEYLTEAGELDDGQARHHQARGLKSSGYALSDDGDRLDLFVSAPVLSGNVETVTKTDVETGLKRLRNFLVKALEGYHQGLEEASDGFDMALSIWQARDDLARIRLYFLTDGVTRIEKLENERIGGAEVSYHVWDLRRIYQAMISGRGREQIEIDFTEFPGGGLDCLVGDPGTGKYRSFLGVMPARMLVDLYSRYGPRLLERNVRSFLQLRGKVNKAIRATIRDEPDMFLAYNNGLSITAEGVEVESLGSGMVRIRSAKDFQIVNGGQTTGSVYRACIKDGLDVDGILVPIKITEILRESSVEEIAPRISLYANSQNRVSVADFSSNHKFHIKVEELSRTIWAPPAEGLQKQTRWYYERARGQYMDDKSREGTPARRKKFEALNPRRQMIAKTDLAKFENTWNQLPHIVSRGAQKSFLYFMDQLDKRGGFEPDEAYFRNLVAKAILFRKTERIVSDQKFGGYRANIVTFTLSWLYHDTAQRIDLEAVWAQQDLSSSLYDTIETICHKAHAHIISPPGGANITEWCKKEACWEDFRTAEISVPEGLRAELRKKSAVTQRKASVAAIEEANPEELALIEEVALVPAEVWFALSGWAKETGNLQGWQRGIAYSLGQRAGRNQEPSRKQAIQARKILQEAERLGFSVEKATG